MAEQQQMSQFALFSVYVRLTSYLVTLLARVYAPHTSSGSRYSVASCHSIQFLSTIS